MTDSIDELVEMYKRSELDEMATDLGIDPFQYTNKRTLVEAIVNAKDEPKMAPAVEEKTPPPTKTPKRVGKTGVFAKMKETEAAVKKINVGVCEIQNGMREKADVVERAVKNIHSNIQRQSKKNEAAVGKMCSNTQQQAKENEAAVKKINVGVCEIQNGMKEKADVVERAVKNIHSNIQRQSKKNEAAVGKMCSNTQQQAKENEAAVGKMCSNIKKLQNQTTKYINDFYYA